VLYIDYDEFDKEKGFPKLWNYENTHWDIKFPNLDLLILILHL
jgi:hypothetical protein